MKTADLSDLTGQTFGDMIALSDSGERRRGLIMWRCRCSCGAELLVRSDRLTGGKKRYCSWEKHGRPSVRLRTKIKLSPAQVQEELHVCEATLRKWRKTKVGPPYYREVNRIFYYREDIEAWKQAAKWG
jgi:Helix-turn-helix domain